MRPFISNHRRTRESGFSLVELMVALAIGSIMIAGAVYVYSQSRTTYMVNDSMARMQEEARYAFSLIEPDIQLAGFYGYTNLYDGVQLTSGGVVTPVVQTQQTDPAAPGLLASVDDCGRNFAVDLMMTIQGSDNSFTLGPVANAPGIGSGCAVMMPLVGTPLNTPDTLTTRRVSTTLGGDALEANRLQVYIDRLQPTRERMFVNGIQPGPIVAGRSEIHNLMVRTYYVARDSDGRAGFPALRVISLGSGEAFTDFELVPGVEDLQVQFGIDSGDYNNDGAIDQDVDANGIPDGASARVTQYVDSDANVLLPPPAGRNAQVVTVRIWLRLRAEQPEIGFTDTRNYVYANVNYTPAGAEQGFRRLLISRTIYLRNARAL